MGQMGGVVVQVSYCRLRFAGLNRACAPSKHSWVCSSVQRLLETQIESKSKFALISEKHQDVTFVLCSKNY